MKRVFFQFSFSPVAQARGFGFFLGVVFLVWGMLAAPHDQAAGQNILTTGYIFILLAAVFPAALWPVHQLWRFFISICGMLLALGTFVLIALPVMILSRLHRRPNTVYTERKPAYSSSAAQGEIIDIGKDGYKKQ